MFNLYASKKTGGYELITNTGTIEQARKKAEKLSRNEYHSYMIILKSREQGDQVIERKELEEIEWER